MGPRNRVSDGSPDTPWEGAILGKEVPTVKYRDFVLSAVQKWLYRSTCLWVVDSRGLKDGTLAQPSEYD